VAGEPVFGDSNSYNRVFVDGEVRATLSGVPRRALDVFLTLDSGPAPQNITMHAKSMQNLLRGVVERIFLVNYGEGYVQPFQPTPGSIDKLKPFRDKVLKTVRRVKKMTTDEFLSSYDRRILRERYRKAAEKREITGVTPKHARIKPFGKLEKTNKSAKPDPVQRVISQRDPIYAGALGEYVKPVEKPLCVAVARVYNEKDPPVNDVVSL